MDLSELVTVSVSPFEVSTHQDTGYLATHSISGSRFDAPTHDLPFAIQAFTPSFIQDQRPVNIFDVVRYSPGVTYRSNDFNEGNANVAIRGFAVSATPGNIQVLRDGFHGPSIFDFTNVARVEVAKGPASFLYGQVAPGGIVNVITKSPQEEFSAAAHARYGSYGQYRFEGDVTGPALDNLFLRLATSYDQDMNYWEPYDGRSWALAPSLTWQPTEHVRVSVRYETFHKSETPQVMQKPGYGRQAGVIPTPSDPNLVGTTVASLPDNWNGLSNSDFRNSDTHVVNAWLDLHADEHWNLRAGYSHLTYKVDAVFTGNFGLANNSTSIQGRRVRGQTYTNQGDTFEAEAVGKYAFNYVNLRMLLGGQFVDRSFDNRAGQAPNDPALGDDPTASPLPLWDLEDPSTWDRNATVPRSSLTENPADRTIKYRDRSLFAGTTFGFFNDRLLVLAGWRLTSTENRITDRIAQRGQVPITGVAITPQYGLLYEFLPDVSVYASYAESFVSGTQVLRTIDGMTQAARPTRGRGVDFGLKSELLGGRLSGTLTLFDIRNRNIVNDLAETDATGSVTIYNLQSGEQRSRGVELSVTATPIDGWQLYLSYSYMDARILEVSGNDEAILAQDPARLDAGGQANYKAVRLLHNAPLQMSAPHLANLWTRYDLPQGPLQGLHVGAGFNFVYNQTVLPDAPASQRQTYTLLNAMLGYAWTWGGYEFTADLMGKNLADQRYRPSQSTRSRPRELLFALAGRFSP